VQTGFVNYSSQNVPGTYNLRLSGLDPEYYYKIQILGSESNLLSSADNNGSRTSFTINNITKSLATRYNTSSAITFDTLKPDANGYIYLNVTGYDTTYTASAENYGIISAMKIYQISKTEVGSSLSELSKHYYDTLMIQDGSILRECNFYMPYNYNPSKKYGLIIYLAGQEQAVSGYNFDPAIGSSYGLGYVVEHEKDKIYGLDSNGDTISYFIIIPQYSINEYSGTPTGIDSIISTFASRYSANYNDSLYMVGFSSGGAATMNYLYAYPSKIKGIYVSSAAFYTGKSSMIPTQTLIDSSAKFQDYGLNIWMCFRPDGFQNNMDTIYKYIYAVDSNHVRQKWFWTLHRAFTWEYTMSQQVDPIYEQTPYDFFANPYNSNLDDSVGFFSIGTSAVQEPDPSWGNLSGYFTPTRGVFTGTDSTLHITISTVDTSYLHWKSTTGPSHTKPVYKDQLYNYYANQYTDNNGFNNTLIGTYENNGYNILMTGCKPNTKYQVWFKGTGVIGNDPHNIAAFYTPTDSIIIDQSAAIYQQMPVPLMEVSDESGNLYFGMYAKQGQAFLNYIIIKEVHTIVSQFNFNATSQSISGWIDVSGSPDTGTITATDNQSGISVSSIGSAYWPVFGGATAGNTNGSNVDDGGGFVFGTDVTRSCWYSASDDTLTDIQRRLEISGLNDTDTYKIELLFSADPTKGAPTGQTMKVHLNEVAGTFKQSVVVDNNSSNLVTYDSVTPVDGKIFIDINSGTAKFIVLNGLRITKN